MEFIYKMYCIFAFLLIFLGTCITCTPNSNIPLIMIITGILMILVPLVIANYEIKNSTHDHES